MLERVVLSFVFEVGSLGSIGGRNSESLEVHLLVVEAVQEVSLGVSERDEVVGALRTRDGGFYGAEIEFNDVREDGVLLWVGIISVHAYGLQVRRSVLAMQVRATSQLHVVNGLVIDGEEAHGGSSFGRHVSDRGSVRKSELGDTRTEELYELVNDALLTQIVGNSQYQVGGSHLRTQLSGQLVTDDWRQYHRDGLVKHD